MESIDFIRVVLRSVCDVWLLLDVAHQESVRLIYLTSDGYPLEAQLAIVFG
jgi:hypothetical protein